ncbi:fluoride efflux transporter CrcB [Butyrivibrio proteoclasticus]|uniref:fluoride efflux transporter CrcB n=1 Tax=Butyrivibrio proteoclasticus TaxID=43305 RepID=UPI00047AA3AC|nr:fluoride efflux transporter CrcB [Butyrivibrio proteoclasticus]
MSFLFVALGGALGAVARYTISLIPVKTGFPVLTLITNILGAILIGFIVGITSNREGISENTVLFWKTGVCGGFTTFSTFSLEAFNLFDKKQYVYGGLYVALSVICCIAGIYCGKKLADMISL